MRRHGCVFVSPPRCRRVQRRRCPLMMGEANPQPAFFYNISLETFVAADHPLRAIRPLIDDRAIRRACRDLCSPIGRPSIPPEQLFFALVGGYLLGITSDRKFVWSCSATWPCAGSSG